jgi:hypothetical protein
MVTEVASILVAVAAATDARFEAKRSLTARRRGSLILVVACLINLGVLAATGFLHDLAGLFALLHALTGHLMLPLVSAAVGLWLGSPKPCTGRSVFPLLFRVVFLLVLCFLCLSNTWTGYLGPSRFSPDRYPENALRFRVFHQWAAPIIIGTMLLIWLRRLARGRIAERTAGPV